MEKMVRDWKAGSVHQGRCALRSSHTDDLWISLKKRLQERGNGAMSLLCGCGCVFGGLRRGLSSLRQGQGGGSWQADARAETGKGNGAKLRYL